MSPAKRVMLSRASRGPCRAQDPRLSRRKQTSLPLGRAGVRVVGDARAKKPVADAWPPYTPRPTPHVPNNNPPPAFGHLPQGGGSLLSETELFEH